MRLVTRLYGFAFLSDFILLYPLYALLFSGAGLSTAEITSLLAIWSVTGFVLEVPSGVWADTVSRRRLLVIAPLLAGGGFGLWVLEPSYPVLALGFVLWGAQGALQSGAFEALAYEELERVGAADRYARHMGRATALGVVAAGVATGLAAPAFAVGGFAAVGVASVIACVAAAAVAAGLPEHRRPARPGPGGAPPTYRETLRRGLAEVRRAPAVRRALATVAAVTAIWGTLDEYLPLLAVEVGVAVADVPFYGLLVYAGMAAGGVVAGRAAGLGGRRLAAALVGAAAALAAGALLREPAGFAVIALAFGGFQAISVVADARLQGAVEGDARATVTSLGALMTEVVVLAVFAGYAAGSAVAGHWLLFAAAAALYLPAAVLMARGARRDGGATG